MNDQKHILFHRPTPWDSSINCSTKIFAKLFSGAGYKVTYLQDTINPGHRILRRGYYSTWKKGARFENTIWVTGGFSLVPYFDGFKSLARITSRLSYLTCIPSIQSLVYASGYGDPDIIWTTIPGSTVLKELFPKAKLFFHVIDNYSAYRGDGVTGVEASDYKKADHIFVIGQALNAYLQKKFGVEPEKITNLGQGVALDKYTGKFIIPEELQTLPKPIAIWVGLIKKLDIGLLKVTIDTMKRLGGSTVLIGPGSEQFKHCLDDESAIWLGPKSSDEIPNYLRSSDIGLMLYDRKKKEIYEGQNPLKLYEYAAAGLPTLSTWHEEYEYIHPPILPVVLKEDIADAINRAITNKIDLHARMQKFAHSHSWDACKEKAEKVFAKMEFEYED